MYKEKYRLQYPVKGLKYLVKSNMHKTNSVEKKKKIYFGVVQLLRKTAQRRGGSLLILRDLWAKIPTVVFKSIILHFKTYKHRTGYFPVKLCDIFKCDYFSSYIKTYQFTCFRSPSCLGLFFTSCYCVLECVQLRYCSGTILFLTHNFPK